MNYDYWLDFIEVMIKAGKINVALFLEVMRKFKADKFWVLGKEDKLEVIKPNEC